MSKLAIIAVTAIFSSNIVAISGVGAVSLQSEKRNFLFMLISSFFTMLSIILAGFLYNVFEIYILKPLELEYLKLFVVTLLSCVCAFISKSLIKVMSKEDYFLYEKSYSFPTRIAVNVGTLLIISLTETIAINLYTLFVYSVGYVLAQVIFYGLYERLDNSQVLKPARNVPVMLLSLSVVSMIFYVVSMFF